MIEATSILLLGLVLLLVGSDLLVTTTERIANTLSISNFFASFFLIGIATSAPEIFISIESAIQNQTILAVGNALGSNISNIALVFAISMLFVNLDTYNFSLPTKPFISMIVLSGITFILIFFDKTFTSGDSIILILIFMISIYFFKSKPQDEDDTRSKKYHKSTILFLYLVTSLALLLYGSHLFIQGATEIAIFFGITTYVIGLTLAALGTSLPELAASIQSARKGKVDFIAGNIIGSNIFNIAIAMTAAGIINPAFLNNTNLLRDFVVLAFSTFIFYLIIKSKNILKTVYSVVLVIIYLLYIEYIFK
jgi:cation:H+ antiporter